MLAIAEKMVLPLCHYIRPLSDSRWFQALRNTGNESHPRDLAAAAGLAKGPAKGREWTVAA